MPRPPNDPGQSSMYNTVRGAAQSAYFARWPNPFNGIKDIAVLSCDPYVDIQFTFYLNFAGNFFWTSFIPQPSEITRKIFLGNYKCGFYLPIKFPSPMNVIFGANTVKVIASILRPALTGLWAFWAASTAYNALATWTSIVYEIENCEQENASVVAIGGSGNWVSDNPGAPVGWNAVFDPNGWMEPSNTVLSVPAGGVQSMCTWLIQNNTNIGVLFEVWMYAGTRGESERKQVSIGPGGDASVTCEGSFVGNASAVQPRGECLTDIAGHGSVVVACARWYTYHDPAMVLPPKWPPEPPNNHGCPACIKDDYYPEALLA